jgi:hypothetical protein
LPFFDVLLSAATTTGGANRSVTTTQSPKAQVTRNLGTNRWYNIIPFLFYLTRSVSLLSSCIGHQGLDKHKNISKKKNKETNKKTSPHH